MLLTRKNLLREKATWMLSSLMRLWLLFLFLIMGNEIETVCILVITMHVLEGCIQRTDSRISHLRRRCIDVKLLISEESTSYIKPRHHRFSSRCMEQIMMKFCLLDSSQFDIKLSQIILSQMEMDPLQ